MIEKERVSNNAHPLLFATCSSTSAEGLMWHLYSFVQFQYIVMYLNLHTLGEMDLWVTLSNYN